MNGKKQTRWWEICLIILSIGTTASLAHTNLENWFPQDIINLLAVIISWPITVLVIFSIFLTKFESSIQKLIENLRLKFSNGMEVQAQQPLPEHTGIDNKTNNITLTEEDQRQIQEIITKQAEEKAVLETAAHQTVIEATIWKFRYLDNYLIHSTKDILYWFSLHDNGTTRSNFLSSWTQYIPDTNQQDSILDALFTYGLLIETNNLITITQQGFLFLQFIGRVPVDPKTNHPEA